MCDLCVNNPFVDWHALDPQEAGTAAGGSSNGTSVGFNSSLVDQLDSGSFWYTSSGAVASTISYGFTTSNAFATTFGEAPGWSAFTAAQKTATREIMGLWDDLIAPSLVESTGSANTADIKLSNTTTDISYAHAYFPGQVNSEASGYDKILGSVWLNSAYNSGVNNLVTPTSGVYGYMAIMHEIGHSLGLNHGGNYNGGSPAYGNTATGWLYTEDSRQFTIMSYFNASATGANWAGKYAQTPMVYDIMAIQQMYGADYTTRAGDTVYGFNSTAGSALYNFSLNITPILTIWDGNGIDTLDLSGWSTSSTITLTAGSYSSVNGMTKNLAIAYDVDIENATTGSGNDNITGNDLGNVLTGNGGNDTINGAGGNDTINGGAGVDILTGGTGNDTIYFDALDNLTLLNGGSGFDTLIQLGILVAFDYVGHSFEQLLNIISDMGSAVWAEQTDYYDVNGLHTETEILYDDGTRSVTEYDIYNTETWSEWTVTYDASGNFLSEVFVPDDGLPPNAAPTITSNGAGATAAVNVVENSTAVTTVTASDTDAGTVLAYSIVGGADAARFTINATTGALSFVSAPNFELPGDAGANNVYDVQVQVSDGTLTDTQTIAVTVTNQNEAPAITSNGGGATAAISISENGTAVTTVTASDTDAGTVLAYSIVGGADAARFTINATTGVLSFVSAPNFELPGDAGANNIYDVQVQVSDGTLTDTQSIAVTVTNQNEAPAITSNGGGATAAVNVVENTTAVTTVTASDPDAGATRTYSIVGGADAARFTINATTGVLSFVTAPNTETPTDAGANNVYDVQVQVSDGALTDTQSIAVTVTNQNEAPAITSNGAGATAAISISENGTAVTTVTASDTDAGTVLAYSIVGGADAARFTINATTGVLSFVSAPNFELPGDAGANNIYDVQVQVSDGTLTDTQSIAVTVTNQNEAPAITSNGGGATASISVAENTTAVTTVTASDPDAGATRTYSIVGGADAARFTINATTGVLSFVTAPNTETPTDAGANNVYDVQVQVSDGSLTDTQSIAVTVTNQNEAPAITSNGAGATAAISISENGTAVTTVTASDTDAGTVLAYSIVGGADAARFTINATTGVLSFVSAPNFELPGDAGANNIYDVQVQVSDGTLTDTQSIAVTVTNQNEAPTITSIDGGAAVAAFGGATAATISVAEGGTAVTTVTASDPDFGAVLTYSIVNGADVSKFTINAATGVLSFVSATDFEAPIDVGADNVYEVEVQVSDGALTDTQAIEVIVTDVDDATIVTAINGTSSKNVLTGTAGPNIIDGLAGNDSLAGLGGADTLIGGQGTDTATYVASAAGVNVSLMTGLGSGGDAQGDTLSTIENLTGSGFNDTLEGNGGNNVLAGGLGVDTVSYAHALAGVKVNLSITKGQNTSGAGTDTLSGFENLTGSAFNDTLTGNTANNTLRGLGGNDTLNGSAGADTMIGGTGNDTYVVDTVGDIVDETGGDGTDTIQSSFAFSLAALGLIENLTLTGSAAITGTGNNLNNVITGNSGANTLTGLGGNDTLNGGAGADTMIGGTGNDTYVVDNAGDIVDETGGSGTDTVQSSMTLSLAAMALIENLTLTGSAAINGTGNDLNNVIAGNNGKNVLTGGLGIDTVTYEHVLAGVTVNLATASAQNTGSAGADTLSGFENLTGSAFNDTLTGNADNNVLKGLAGNDTLNGGGGLDTMIGGSGNDTYVVDNTGSIVSELDNEGTDTVQASITFSLAATAFVENLTLTGLGAINGTGNGLNNLITGNSGANILIGLAGDDTLNGGLGADTMIGGTGNDTYVVDNAGDIVDETGGSGTDTVQSSFAFSLAALGLIENLTLTGSAAITGTGNNLNNVITGNSGANTLTGLGGNDTLNGGAGADTMIGGTGNDTYVVDNAGDIVDETGGSGTDTVQSSMTLTLAALGLIENLTLTGSAAINGTGNDLNNVIAGNNGNNILAGLGGADTLIGGQGTDTAAYAASAAGVNVSLMTGLGSGGDAQGDTLSTIENLTGSGFSDTLEGNGGNNVLTGGLGVDTVSYEHSLAGVKVNLSITKGQNTSGAGTDTLSGFENLTGSAFNDTLTGNTANNTLRGLAGNDILTGGSGSDAFDFSSLVEGSDVITDFVTGLDHIDLVDLLDSVGLGNLDYATLVAQGNLVIETGNYATGTNTNSAKSLDTRFYVDADGFGAGSSVLIATLEDTLTNAGDFLV